MSRIALVTGGGRGIGRAIVLKLAAEGLDVAIVYAGNDEAAEATRAEAEALGVRAKKYLCDVSDFEACAALAAQVTEELGQISVLVNNAGITRDMLAMRMKEQDFDRVIQVNLKGAFNTTRHFFKSLMRAKDGRIVNISSVVGISGNAGQANYCAAKAGLIGLTKSIAREIAGRGATCNAVAPGMIETDMTSALAQDVKDKYYEMIPLRRAGSAQEVAAAVAFLASPEAGYITGTVIPVDGGMGM